MLLRRAAAFVAVVALASPALADVPPSPDSPDAHCTLKEQCAGGEFCPYAFTPGKPPAPGETPLGQSCRSAAEAKGLERRCRNGGNYSGQTLYCPKGETGSWSPPGSAAKLLKCSAGAGDNGGAAALLFGVAGLVLMARRRR